MQIFRITPYARAVLLLSSGIEEALRLHELQHGKLRWLSVTFRGSAAPARRVRIMTWVKHNIRLSPAQDRTLVRFAEQRGLTRYKMLGRVVDHGLAVVENGASAPNDLRDLADEVAAISIRFAELERVLDRALFTACAGYSYARQAALGGRRSDEAITAEAIAAYERQRSLANEAAS